MDIDSIMKTMLGSETVKGLSETTGVSQKSVKSVLSSALPSLIDGAVSQAQNKSTSSSFANALAEHAQDDTRDLSSFFSGVDLSDGSKIIGHLLGGKASATTQKAAENAGVSTTKAGNILSGAAPLLMSLLGQQASSGSGSSSNGNSSGIGGLLGNLLSNVDIGSLFSGLISAVSTNTADEDQTTAAKKKTSKKKTQGTTASTTSGKKTGTSSSKKKTSGTSSAKKTSSTSSKKNTSASSSKKKTSKKDDGSDENGSGGILGSILGMIGGK
ncbi:MAG: DUF937 domain-containing protein [Clostridia bacterium]|nr:DUF937 domain-containing protein [Clostridia bacterium]